MGSSTSLREIPRPCCRINPSAGSSRVASQLRSATSSCQLRRPRSRAYDTEQHSGPSWNSMAYHVPSFEFPPTFRRLRVKPEPWPEWERPICRAAMARLPGSPTTSKRELAMFQEAELNVFRFGIMSSNVSYEDQSMSSLQIRNKVRFP